MKLKESMDVEVDFLKHGDYFVRGLDKNIIVERKSVLDLVHAVPHRLFEQVLGLMYVENAEPRLLIEGSLDEAIHKTQWSKNSIVGVLVSVEEDFKIPLFSIPALSWLPNYLSLLQRNIGTPKEKKFFPLRVKPKMRTQNEMSRCVIEGFKSVGPSRANALLIEFKSVRNICNASLDDLSKVVGKKGGAVIYGIINYQWHPGK